MSVQMQSASHIWLLSLAFFYSTVTPTLSAYTIDSMEYNGQAYTAIRIPHRRGTRESQKQLSELLATTSTKWSYTYRPRDTQVDYAPLIS